MKENMAKREGMLLGKLNRERHRAPVGIISNDAWAADGESIRALGVRMGSKLDTAAWWTKKYRCRSGGGGKVDDVSEATGSKACEA